MLQLVALFAGEQQNPPPGSLFNGSCRIGGKEDRMVKGADSLNAPHDNQARQLAAPFGSHEADLGPRIDAQRGLRGNHQGALDDNRSAPDHIFDNRDIFIDGRNLSVQRLAALRDSCRQCRDRRTQGNNTQGDDQTRPERTTHYISTLDMLSSQVYPVSSDAVKPAL